MVELLQPSQVPRFAVYLPVSMAVDTGGPLVVAAAPLLQFALFLPHYKGSNIQLAAL